MLSPAAFRAQAEACGRAYYVDRSLEPQELEAAYRIYRNACRGTKLEDFEGQPVNFGVTIVGRLERRDEDGVWIPSNESFPSIDEILKQNLGTLDEDPSDGGAVLDAANWSLLANDAWLLGGIEARTEFHFASPSDGRTCGTRSGSG